MSKTAPMNIAASVRQKLLDRSRARGEDFNLTLIRYASERFLYRLSRTEHADKLVLKGAMLFALWTETPHRPTADLDFLGRGVESEAELRKIFAEACRARVEPDGLTFHPESVTVEPIREDQAYRGFRVRSAGNLGKARVSVQADVGFGDVVKPREKSIAYPTILDLPAPRIKAYPPEAVVAEKFQAMVNLGMANSRMKDFFDLYVMARIFNFEGQTLAEAVSATFRRRKTRLPIKAPLALSEEFSGDAEKEHQWKGFLKRNRLDASAPDLGEVVRFLSTFLTPMIIAISTGTDFKARWSNGGPWKKEAKESRRSSRARAGK